MEKINIPISNLLCCGCGQEIEKRLLQNPHVKTAAVNFLNSQVSVSFDKDKISEEEIKAIIKNCGYNPKDTSFKDHSEHMGMESGQHSNKAMKKLAKMSWWSRFKMNMTMTMDMNHSGHETAMLQSMEDSFKIRFIFSLILSLPIIFYSPLGIKLLGLKLPTPIPVNWLLLFLTTSLFLYGGFIFIYGSYRALKNRTLNMSVLIATGILTAYIFSVALTFLGIEESYYEAAAMLITFVLFGHWMEMKSRRGTNESLRALFDLVPPKSRVERDGKEVEIPSGEIELGEVVVIKPGDKIPVDGEVLSGGTLIDESLVTGESLPVEKKKGNQVIGGSVNQAGSIKFRATKVGDETALAQNDAPALAQADVGVAIGAGTDVAIETADVVLMRSEPLDVVSAIRLSKATVNKMKQNLAWASVYNLLAIPVAAGVLYPSFGITLRPEFSALLMSASSIIVATNAVMLKRAEKDLVI